MAFGHRRSEGPKEPGNTEDHGGSDEPKLRETRERLRQFEKSWTPRDGDGRRRDLYELGIASDPICGTSCQKQYDQADNRGKDCNERNSFQGVVALRSLSTNPKMLLFQTGVILKYIQFELVDALGSDKRTNVIPVASFPAGYQMPGTEQLPTYLRRCLWGWWTSAYVFSQLPSTGYFDVVLSF